MPKAPSVGWHTGSLAPTGVTQFKKVAVPLRLFVPDKSDTWNVTLILLPSKLGETAKRYHVFVCAENGSSVSDVYAALVYRRKTTFAR